MFKRGRYPCWMAWRVREKAPLMTAWDAMMVARVVRITVGIMAQEGTMA